MTTAQAARAMGVNPATMWRWVRSGKVPARRVGWGFDIDPGELRLIAAGLPVRRA